MKADATHVRLAHEGEATAVISMALAAAREHRVDKISLIKLHKAYRSYLEDANPTIFVAVKGGKLAGCLAARICEYDHCDGLFTTQRLLYVLPAYRGTRVAASLMSNWVDWSRQLGAAEAIGGKTLKPLRIGLDATRKRGRRRG